MTADLYAPGLSGDLFARRSSGSGRGRDTQPATLAMYPEGV